ncbi:MAG TPA: ABC transporter ATP-binding protein [Candidatus Limnocylindrales bacterium]|nr:ABC transporter ATP-binding protein [Candidatus Limnocylindrales bacterium]
MTVTSPSADASDRGSTNPMIEFRDVTKRYGTLVANDHVSFTVERGEMLTLLGPSGCGKTTALRCLTGYSRPDEGRIFIDGRDVTDLPTYKRNLGMVFQNFALFPHMTAFGNVEFPLKVRSVPTAERKERAEAALRMVRLDQLATRFPRQMSGGQQQRVGLARALAYEPSVLLLDEPLSNLDAKLREEMRFEIKELQARFGITAVYVTHDQSEALALSDRVAVMNAGVVEQLGTPEEIYEAPRSAFVADFIGLSNFLSGRLVGRDGELSRVEVGERTVLARPNDAVSTGDVLVFVRPNDIHLSAAGDASAAARSDAPVGSAPENEFDGTVEQVTYLGDRMDYRVRLESGDVVRVQSEARFGEGAGIRARFRPDHARVMPPRR